MDDQRIPIDGSQKLTSGDYLRRFFHRLVWHTARTNNGVKNHFIPTAHNDYQPHALRPHWMGVYAGAIITVKIVAVVFVSLYADQAKLSDISSSTIVSLSNQARQQNRVPILRTNALLTKAAQAKANDMIAAHYFAHISPSKVTPWYWFKQAGYKYSYAGENLAIDYIQSEDVIQAWLNSPLHRANLLSSKYKDIGVAVATGTISGVESLLVVQMFGTPAPTTIKKSTAPPQTPTPTAAKTILAAAPPAVPAPVVPVVLGETAPLVPPSTPSIVTPSNGSNMSTNIPDVIGRAESGSTVNLFAGGVLVGSTVVPVDGIFTLTPRSPLTDGQVNLAVISVARGLSSDPSPTIKVLLDTVQPEVKTDATYALSSIADAGGYDIWTATSADATSADAVVGQRTTSLVSLGNHRYFGQVRLDGGTNSLGTVAVSAADVAGNQTRTVVIDPDLFSTGVVAPTSGLGVNALHAVFFSRAFLTIFLVLMLIVATGNIVIQIERQHHPTIIASLLVIYLAGALLFV